ncbi:MAG: hypothetical protein F4Z31_20055 [Gemmatimonadetes bacterium]|nr:hypothetical protein [Gemmatimonadota bacterium]MYE93005.1 hypothetical protein [Gemmatimonadota bacterium]MYJ11047.1 hypothetical protein [Gemmatimonadota bacterium]
MRLSLYDQRLEADLDAIRTRLGDIGEQVLQNLLHGVQAVLDLDPRLANETLIKDRAVNQATREIEHLCHLFVARHLPSGSHLRFVSGVLRLSVAMERVGDYSVAICRVARQIGSPLPDTVLHNIGLMSEHARRALKTALDGFLEGDPDAAHVSRGFAAQTAAVYPYAFEILNAAADSDSRPARDLFGALLVFRLLQRTAEQAENICQQTLFAVTGERKPEKRYRMLFLDGDNAMASKMAELACVESYPHAGSIGSAGLEAATGFAPALLGFCRRRGIVLTADDAPRAFADALDPSWHYHVIVGLGVDPANHCSVPYRTAALRWDLQEDASDGQPNAEELYRELMQRIRGLMTTLGVREDE